MIDLLMIVLTFAFIAINIAFMQACTALLGRR